MLVDRGAARYPAKVMDEERFLCHCNLVLSKDDWYVINFYTLSFKSKKLNLLYACFESYTNSESSIELKKQSY